MSNLPSLARLLISTTNPRAKAAIRARMQSLSITNRRNSQAQSVRDQITSCRNCHLGYTRHHAVPFTGPTHSAADLVLVGEAPGNTEDKRGEPFVGWAGEMLDHLLISAGTSREKCFIMNALCCIPREGRSFREPAQDELDACRPNFESQLALSGCKVGVALGGYAWGAVKKLPRQMVRVKPLLNQVFWVDGRIWLVTYHPSYVRRNVGSVDKWSDLIGSPEDEKQEIGRDVVRSLQFALSISKGDIMVPKIPWGKVRIGGKYSEELGKALTKKRWALYDSATFGCQIVIVDDSRGGTPTLPHSLSQTPIYTVNELWKLGLIGEGESRWTVGDMRRLHFVKVEMGGEVIA